MLSFDLRSEGNVQPLCVIVSPEPSRVIVQIGKGSTGKASWPDAGAATTPGRCPSPPLSMRTPVRSAKRKGDRFSCAHAGDAQGAPERLVSPPAVRLRKTFSPTFPVVQSGVKVPKPKAWPRMYPIPQSKSAEDDLGFILSRSA